MRSMLRGVTPLATAIFSLVACSSGNANEIKAPLGKEFVLPVGQTVSIDNGQLLISFESVTADSRCPKGVTCIWAGEAKCRMQITNEGSTSDIVFTETGGTDGYSQSTFNNYTAHFRLEPYPEAGKQIGSNDYKLLLTITES